MKIACDDVKKIRNGGLTVVAISKVHRAGFFEKLFNVADNPRVTALRGHSQGAEAQLDDGVWRRHRRAMDMHAAGR